MFNDKYATLPFQLELPFEGIKSHCPVCAPSGSPRDRLRSMCGRHWREFNSAFDSERFRVDAEKALEEGRKARIAAEAATPRPWPRSGVRYR